MNTDLSLIRLSLVVMLALTLVPLAASQNQNYSITDLGSLDPGGIVDVSYSGGINNFGQVVGSSYTALSLHAYLWTKQAGMQDLGTLGGSNSLASAINDFGTIAGQSDLADGTLHAFNWTKSGGMQDLGTLGGSDSAAFGINQAGQIVGEAFLSNGTEHAFLWTAAGGMQDLGTLGGDTSTAYAINNSAEIVGSSSIAGSGAIHAFLWTKAKGMQDLGTIKSYNPSYAFAINDLGQLVGYAGITQAFTVTYGFLRNPGQKMKGIGFLEGGTQTFPAGINILGEIVGSFSAGSGVGSAFRWTAAQGMQDLNLLLPPDSGWMLNYGNAINDVRQIVGSGPVLINGNYTNHAFLMSPR